MADPARTVDNIGGIENGVRGSESGEVGFVHEVVQRHLRADALSGVIDAYACGPPPMIDAVLPVLQMNAIDLDHIYFDRFTPAVR